MAWGAGMRATIPRMERNSQQHASKGKGRRAGVPLWLVVLAAAAALIVLGVAQGDALDVWRKASMVCFECIGIG